jgi:hypothetical protein
MVSAANKEQVYGLVRPDPTKHNRSQLTSTCLGGTPPKLDGNVYNNHPHAAPTTPIFLMDAIVTKQTRTLDPWRPWFSVANKEGVHGLVHPNPTKLNRSRLKSSCLGGTPPKLDGNVVAPTTPIFLTDEIVTKQTRTLVLSRLRFQQPTKNEYMGGFTQTLRNTTNLESITIGMFGRNTPQIGGKRL